MYFISATYFDLTLRHHLALQILQNITEIYKISLPVLISQHTMFNHVALQVRSI